MEATMQTGQAVPQRRIRVRLVVKERYAQEVRCGGCHALLFKALPLVKSAQRNLGIEVKCRRCGRLNQY